MAVMTTHLLNNYRRRSGRDFGSAPASLSLRWRLWRGLQQFIAAVRTAFDLQAERGELPILLSSPAIRPYVRSIIERFRPATTVMSQNEVHGKAQIKTLGQV